MSRNKSGEKNRNHVGSTFCRTILGLLFSNLLSSVIGVYVERIFNPNPAIIIQLPKAPGITHLYTINSPDPRIYDDVQVVRSTFPVPAIGFTSGLCVGTVGYIVILRKLDS